MSDQTTDPRSSQKSQLRVDLREALEEAGLKMTRQREAVYEKLREACHHPTAEEVFQGVKSVLPSISLATVYKSLEALTACGLATKLSDAAGSARYDARPDHHYHLRCERSGTVEDLPTHFDPTLVERLDPEIRRYLTSIGFEMTGYRLELLGYFKDRPIPSPAGEDGEE